MLKIAGMCPVVHPLVLLLVLFCTHPISLTRVWIHCVQSISWGWLHVWTSSLKGITQNWFPRYCPFGQVWKTSLWEPVALIKLKGFVLSANLHLGSTIHYSHSHKWVCIGCEASRTPRVIYVSAFIWISVVYKMWYVGVTKSGTWLKYIIQIQKRNCRLCSVFKGEEVYFWCIYL